MGSSCSQECRDEAKKVCKKECDEKLDVVKYNHETSFKNQVKSLHDQLARVEGLLAVSRAKRSYDEDIGQELYTMVTELRKTLDDRHLACVTKVNDSLTVFTNMSHVCSNLNLIAQ